ncbi:MAG: electron transfer flavoprotein subunit alpha/FixB family protein [Flavobacteriales bacterium]|nr:electron transfer flavoprotein subunit alpha/FixB family protein [Flavobacteriales bacterium]MCX7649806.1 electron transfer flavoprotein subunit alpha/FixB family protein [Flavobacteriales bacterium]MDW8431561.1 electron transfer flavoprotein subunit alpha/FixB family protein [Flavobacteriales bacterium]
MNILVFAESQHGAIKKSGLEAVTYAARTASQHQGTVTCLVAGVDENVASGLGAYGAHKVLKMESHPDALGLSDALSEAIAATQARLVVLAYDALGRHLAPRLSARLGAALISGASGLPEIQGDTLRVRKSVFSGKAFATLECSTPIKILAFSPNTLAPEKKEGTAEVVSFSPATRNSRIRVIKTEEKQGEVALPDAEIVVSAGRGLKGPENWGIVEDLAHALNAATACSRPVADIGWRPHHEHVGQTGLTVRPNLYIAIGISGAIQHLAGVNQSKVIVVINKDPEAPFFKAADYGIVGDAFEVVPRITEAVKKLKAGA